MTKEEKEILLADLCARSPYKVKVQIDFGEHCIKYGIDRYVDDTVICVYPETFEVGVNNEDQACDIEDVKPYLRPMSSMTEDEQEEYKHLQTNYEFAYFDNAKSIHWLIKNHFDYLWLIPMGLALQAPKDMYKS